MKFVVRDDDTCAMTRPEELEACYAGVWERIPIGLSVTPFRIPGSTLGVPEALMGSREPLPLEGAGELVSFLREKIANRTLHVALHGYHHDRPGDRPEYVAGSGLASKTREGKAYLEQLLDCRVETFVPPNNQLGRAGFAAVAAAGLNLVNNQPYPRAGTGPVSFAGAVDLLIAAQYSLRSRIGRPHPFAIRRFVGFQQAPYHTLGPQSSLDDLLAKLRACRRSSGVFVLATHYHAFDRVMKSGESVREGFERLVAEVDETVECPTYDELW